MNIARTASLLTANQRRLLTDVRASGRIRFVDTVDMVEVGRLEDTGLLEMEEADNGLLGWAITPAGRAVLEASERGG